MGFIVAICDRLKEERKRLGFTQSAFAEFGGIGLSTYKLYESGEREPGAYFIAAIGQAGANIQYIVSGESAGISLTPEERLIIDRYRNSDRALKDAAMRVLILGEGTSEAKVVNVIATGGQAAGRNIKNVNIGSVTHDSSKSKGPPRSSSRSRHT